MVGVKLEATVSLGLSASTALCLLTLGKRRGLQSPPNTGLTEKIACQGICPQPPGFYSSSGCHSYTRMDEAPDFLASVGFSTYSVCSVRGRPVSCK